MFKNHYYKKVSYFRTIWMEVHWGVTKKPTNVAITFDYPFFHSLPLTKDAIVSKVEKKVNYKKVNNLSDHRLWPRGNFPSMSHRFWDQAKNKFCHCEANFEASIFLGCPISHAWVIIDKKTDEYILGMLNFWILKRAALKNAARFTCCSKRNLNT